MHHAGQLTSSRVSLWGTSPFDLAQSDAQIPRVGDAEGFLWIPGPAHSENKNHILAQEFAHVGLHGLPNPFPEDDPIEPTSGFEEIRGDKDLQGNRPGLYSGMGSQNGTFHRCGFNTELESGRSSCPAEFASVIRFLDSIQAEFLLDAVSAGSGFERQRMDRIPEQRRGKRRCDETQEEKRSERFFR